MSAYICEDKTLENIVDGLWNFSDTCSEFLTWARARNLGDPIALACALRKLNTKSVNYRYQERTRFIEPQIADLRKNISIVQFYKSLGCFLYQASEGPAGKSKLFTALNNLHHALAHHIVMNSPEYDQASWQ